MAAARRSAWPGCTRSSRSTSTPRSASGSGSRRRNLLFDENLPRRLVRALREELGEAAYHVLDVLGASTPDEDVLRYAGGQAWCTVSSDRRILRRPSERAVISELGLGSFFLNDSVSGFCTIVRTVMHNWPEMKRIAACQPRPFLYLVRPRSLAPMRRRNLG